MAGVRADSEPPCTPSPGSRLPPPHPVFRRPAALKINHPVVIVPMTRPVGGISIGLCTEHDDQGKITSYKLLTDIIPLG